MATVFDLIEVTNISEHTTYSVSNGSILGVVDGALSTDLDDGEWDEGDQITIGGVVYSVDEIEEPSSSGRFTLTDGTERSFDPSSESNLDVMFLTLTNGGTTRYFILPNDSYGDMAISEIRTGAINPAAGSDAATISLANNAVTVVCFGKGTRVDTRRGSVKIEHLRLSDEVLTLDHGPQRPIWIGKMRVDAEQITQNPALRPLEISFPKDSRSGPFQSLILSRQHRVLLTSSKLKDVCNTPEALVACKDLTALPNVTVSLVPHGIAYYHILFRQHEIIFANSLATESLFLGNQISDWIASQVPAKQMRGLPPMTLARPIISGRAARSLAPTCEFVWSNSRARKRIAA